MTKEQDDFIKDNFNNMSVAKLRKVFNEKFDTSYKTSIFYYHTQRLGLRKHIEHQYTTEEDEFLKRNAPLMSREELKDAFNSTFNCLIKLQAIEQRCFLKGFKARTDGRFKVGSVPWEKTKGGKEEYIVKLKGGNSTSFKKGIVPHNACPVGSSRTIKGISYTKSKDGWECDRRRIWKEHCGEIPDGYKIFSVDGSSDINSLRMIDNETAVVLASNRWTDRGALIFDTAVQYANLYNALRRAKKDKEAVECKMKETGLKYTHTEITKVGLTI